MSQNVVNRVNDAHPELLAANLPEANGRFSALVVEALGPATPGQPGWALLGKSSGENGVTWPNGVRTSHDAIVRVDAAGRKVENVDVIGSAYGDRDWRGTARAFPVWGVVPEHEWRAGNQPVYLSQVGLNPSMPNPNPGPSPSPAPPAVDLGPVLSRLTSIEGLLSTYSTLIDHLANRVAALEGRSAPSELHNGRFFLAMQGDGNLVIYENGTPIWASGTNR